MKYVFETSAMLLLSGSGAWAWIVYPLLFLLCPLTMYFGMRGKRQGSDKPTEDKENAIHTLNSMKPSAIPETQNQPRN
jgi:hypothetical protein